MRARSLKPALFKNELLAVSDPLYTLVFEGLWCLADREGRLEDRPAKIHFDVNPGRAFDGTCGALDWLAENGFIVRYSVGSMRLIEIPSFLKHQKPHLNEKPSVLPAQPLATKVASTCDQGSKHLALNPSSLNPDSPFTEYRESNSPPLAGDRAPEPSEPEPDPARPPIGIPPAINRDALKRWEVWLGSKGKPVNDIARPAIARVLAAIGDHAAQAAAVEHSIARQWVSLRPPRDEGDPLLPFAAARSGRTLPKTADQLEEEARRAIR